MLKLHLFPLAWSFLDSLANAVCYLICVFLSDLDFLVQKPLKRSENQSKYKDTAALPTQECTYSLAGSLGEEGLQGEDPDPVVLQPLVWTWELNPCITSFVTFLKF